MVPEGWQSKTIGDLINFSGGSQPPRKTFVFEPKDEYIRLIQIRDYKTDKYATYIPKGLAKKFCDKDDVMIGRYGPPVFQILRGIKGAYNVALIKATPKKGILRDYMYYFLSQETLQNYIESFSQRGAGQTGIEMDQLNEYPLPLPSEHEQERIVKLLSTWDKAIEKQETLINAKQQRKRALMQQLLTGKKRFKEFEGQKRKSFSFSDIAKLRKEKFNAKTSDESRICIELEHIDQETGILLGSTDSLLQSSTKNAFCAGDVLFGKLRPYLRKFWLADFRGVCSTEIWVLVPQKVITSKYLFYLVQTYEFIAVANVSSGSKMPRADWKYVSEVSFSLPSIAEQQRIASVLSTADQEIQTLQRQLDAYKEQKRGLMQQLLTGKKRVKLDEVTA